MAGDHPLRVRVAAVQASRACLTGTPAWAWPPGQPTYPSAERVDAPHLDPKTPHEP